MTATQTLTTPAPGPRCRRPLHHRGAPSGLVGYLRHALVVAKRSLIKTIRTPEALIDVTIQPVIFLPSLHLPVRRRHRRPGTATPICSSCCPASSLSPSPLAGIALGCESQHRHRKGHLRSLPLAADRPVRAAGRSRGRRSCSLRGSLRGHLRRRNDHGFPGPDQTGCRRWRASDWPSPSPSASAGSRFSSGWSPGPPARCRASASCWCCRSASAATPSSKPSTMPGWLQAFVKVNPISHLVSTCRSPDERRPVRQQPDLDARLDGGAP